ncbi:hypothetical protein ACLOJK_019202 [Asimina triloba]
MGGRLVAAIADGLCRCSSSDGGVVGSRKGLCCLSSPPSVGLWPWPDLGFGKGGRVGELVSMGLPDLHVGIGSGRCLRTWKELPSGRCSCQLEKDAARDVRSLIWGGWVGTNSMLDLLSLIALGGHQRISDRGYHRCRDLQIEEDGAPELGALVVDRQLWVMPLLDVGWRRRRQPERALLPLVTAVDRALAIARSGIWERGAGGELVGMGLPDVRVGMGSSRYLRMWKELPSGRCSC